MLLTRYFGLRSELLGTGRSLLHLLHPQTLYLRLRQLLACGGSHFLLPGHADADVDVMETDWYCHTGQSSAGLCCRHCLNQGSDRLSGCGPLNLKLTSHSLQKIHVMKGDNCKVKKKNSFFRTLPIRILKC